MPWKDGIAREPVDVRGWPPARSYCCQSLLPFARKGGMVPCNEDCTLHGPRRQSSRCLSAPCCRPHGAAWLLEDGAELPILPTFCLQSSSASTTLGPTVLTIATGKETAR